METFTELASVSASDNVVNNENPSLSSIYHEITAVESKDERPQITTQYFTDLLKTSKEQANLTINHLVSSARLMTAEINSSLTAVPLHPYERLLHDSLGSSVTFPSIEELTIPQNFCPVECLANIEKIANSTARLQSTHFSIMSAEAMDTTFCGITSENLNHAFAVLSATADGEKFVVDHAKLAGHLKFIETFKRVPTDYIVKNPIEVAKKMLSEFVRVNSN